MINIALAPTHEQRDLFQNTSAKIEMHEASHTMYYIASFITLL